MARAPRLLLLTCVITATACASSSGSSGGSLQHRTLRSRCVEGLAQKLRQDEGASIVGQEGVAQV